MARIRSGTEALTLSVQRASQLSQQAKARSFAFTSSSPTTPSAFPPTRHGRIFTRNRNCRLHILDGTAARSLKFRSGQRERQLVAPVPYPACTPRIPRVGAKCDSGPWISTGLTIRRTSYLSTCEHAGLLSDILIDILEQLLEDPQSRHYSCLNERRTLREVISRWTISTAGAAAPSTMARRTPI